MRLGGRRRRRQEKEEGEKNEEEKEENDELKKKRQSSRNWLTQAPIRDPIASIAPFKNNLAVSCLLRSSTLLKFCRSQLTPKYFSLLYSYSRFSMILCLYLFFPPFAMTSIIAVGKPDISIVLNEDCRRRVERAWLEIVLPLINCHGLLLGPYRADNTVTTGLTSALARELQPWTTHLFPGSSFLIMPSISLLCPSVQNRKREGREWIKSSTGPNGVLSLEVCERVGKRLNERMKK